MADGRNGAGCLGGTVGAVVVNDDDFVRDTAKIQFEVQVLDSGCDAAFLVARRDDDGE